MIKHCQHHSNTLQSLLISIFLIMTLSQRILKHCPHHSNTSPSSQCLVLSDNNIGSKGAKALSTSLQYIPELTYFNLSHIDTSYTPRTLRACCSQTKFRILKIRESSARVLFLYNCTPNISRSADASVRVA